MRGAASRSSSVSKSGTIVRPGAPPAHRASRRTVSRSAGAAGHRDDERPERAPARRGSASGRGAGRARQVSALASSSRGRRRDRPRLGGSSDEEAQEHRGAVGVVVLREAPASSPSAASMSPSAAARRPESSRMSRRAACRPKVVDLDAHASQAIARRVAAGSPAAIRSSTSGIVDGDARLVRRLVEQPGGHVLLRRRLEVGGEQRQREAIGLAAVAPLEIGHVRRQGSPRVEPGGERGRRRTAPAAHAEAPRRAPGAPRRCRSTASPRCRRSVSAVTGVTTDGLPSRSPPIHEASVSHRRGATRPG